MANKFTLRDASEESMMMGPMDVAPQMQYQQVEFDNDMIQEIDAWQVGETYQLIVDVVMTAKRIPYTQDDPTESDERTACFKVINVGAFEDANITEIREKLGLQ